MKSLRLEGLNEISRHEDSMKYDVKNTFKKMWRHEDWLKYDVINKRGGNDGGETLFVNIHLLPIRRSKDDHCKILFARQDSRTYLLCLPIYIHYDN